MPMKSVAIVGAGIAGLTAALAFARHGVSCDIVEQTGELAEVGAGLQLSPNAARILA
ncbi:FAD-binding protein, partial [Rhizobium sp. BR5]